MFLAGERTVQSYTAAITEIQLLVHVTRTKRVSYLSWVEFIVHHCTLFAFVWEVFSNWLLPHPLERALFSSLLSPALLFSSLLFSFLVFSFLLSYQTSYKVTLWNSGKFRSISSSSLKTNIGVLGSKLKRMSLLLSKCTEKSIWGMSQWWCKHKARKQVA